MTRLRRIWKGMKVRCFNHNRKEYKNYGGRGITICKEWCDNCHTFYDWAKNNGYQDNLTIERIDINGDYCPSNCKWIPIKEQSSNKRKNIVAWGESKSIREWSKDSRCTCKLQILYHRIGSGMNPEQAISMGYIRNMKQN